VAFCIRDGQLPRPEVAAEKVIYFVIPSEARNLSFFCWAETKERFLASLGMTKKVGQYFSSL
jgi:hypothetical protein